MSSTENAQNFFCYCHQAPIVIRHIFFHPQKPFRILLPEAYMSGTAADPAGLLIAIDLPRFARIVLPQEERIQNPSLTLLHHRLISDPNKEAA
jgi:hypothetical protein